MKSIEEKIEYWKKELINFHQLAMPILNVPYSDDHEATFEALNGLGLKTRANSVVQEMIDSFGQQSPKDRLKTSALIDEYDGILWLQDIVRKLKPIEEFKKCVLWFIIRDQGKDTRDAILELNYYFDEGGKSGYPVDSIMSELSELASEKDKYGWGSTKGLIQKRIK